VKRLAVLSLMLLASCGLGGNKTTNHNVTYDLPSDGYAGMDTIHGYLGVNEEGNAELWVNTVDEFGGNYTAVVTGSTHAEIGIVRYAGYGYFRIERLDHTIDYWRTTLVVTHVVRLDAGELGIYYIQL
tara:strand:- start:602 stop:985 length:384 start_codon:yes stop_codon:yes gene_type:complete